MVVTIEKGVIAVTKVPGQDPGKTFIACGKATCSSIHVDGINVDAVRRQAGELGYVHTGTRRFKGKQRRFIFLAIGLPAAAKAVAVCAVAAAIYGSKKGYQLGEHNAKTAAGVPTPPMSKTDKTIGKVAGKIFRI